VLFNQTGGGDMAELDVELTDDLWNWVGHRLDEGRYVDAADYLRDLVRRDMPSHVRADAVGHKSAGGA
jgi:Arc/MetJ-type ribon-helix-helix transcriptional regulator